MRSRSLRASCSCIHRAIGPGNIRAWNVKRFRGGLVFKAHRLVYDSTVGLGVIKKKKSERQQLHPPRDRPREYPGLPPGGFRVYGSAGVSTNPVSIPGIRYPKSPRTCEACCRLRASYFRAIVPGKIRAWRAGVKGYLRVLVYLVICDSG